MNFFAIPLFTLWHKTFLVSDIVGNFFGLAALFFAYRKHILTWYCQIISTILLGGIYIEHHLYGSFGKQIIIFSSSLCGLFLWWKKIPPERPLRYLSRTAKLSVISIVLVGTFCVGLFFSIGLFTTQSPWLDSFIFVGSFTATVLLYGPYQEFWIVWILVDCISLPVNAMHDINGSLLVALVYLVLAIRGFIRTRYNHQSVP